MRYESSAEVKAWLQKAIEAKREIEAIRDRREQLMSLATGITARYGGIGGASGSAGDKIGEAVAKIADIDEALAARLAAYEEIIGAIEKEIDGVEDHRFRQVLRFRYLNGWAFGKIARKMHYDRDYAYKIHCRALEHLYRKSQI